MHDHAQSHEERADYLTRLARSLRRDGHVILGACALNGPTRSGGLPACRYSPQTLSTTPDPDYFLVQALERLPITPRHLYLDFQSTI